MDLKTLARQHDDFKARQERKAARQTAKAVIDADRAHRWIVQKEGWRKTREGREREADLVQQRRLEDDPDYSA